MNLRNAVDDELRLDFLRAQRIGLPEAILCEHKSTPQIVRIVEQALERGASLLLTRLRAEQVQAMPEHLRAILDVDDASRTAFVGPVRAATEVARVAIVTAGSSDVPVARECGRTLTFHGVAHREIFDVGVAGLWRVLERVDELRAMRVVVCVAGMDAALPSVVGGLVPGLVIAVPTSVGYGVAVGGTTALHAALASCSSGVVVVNIDNGYGAACAALRALGSSDALR